jgi:Protein of unknown function (DUF3224)
MEAPIVATSAKGRFEVKMTPQPADDSESKACARLLIDKRFHGDLEATSKGEMLAAGTGVQGSAGYVAIELVTGTLNGLGGTFLLQHNGLMNRGKPDLSVVIIPDSGTAELLGISGRLTIEVEAGKHSYELIYELTESP